MYKNHRVAVVIPAHNEEGFIGQVIVGLPDLVDDIIVIDDCSTDATADAATTVGDPRVRVLCPPCNAGVGGSTLLGYRTALDLGADIVVKMDGDGQMFPEYLPVLLDPLIDKGYDYAKGNRFLHRGALSSMPRHRIFGNIVSTFMTKLASGYWNIFDPQNGYTAIRAAQLRELDFASIHPRFFFENDMLIHLNLLGARVKDVAMPARYGEEVSDLNLMQIGLSFPLLLHMRFYKRIYEKYVLRDFSPIALFLFAGQLLFLWGAIFGLYLWGHSIATHIATPTGTIVLALLPIILGFQLILQAIVLDIQEVEK